MVSVICFAEILYLHNASYLKLSLIIAESRIRGAFNKFPDFFGMDTFINRTHKKL